MTNAIIVGAVTQCNLIIKKIERKHTLYLCDFKILKIA